jgi:hypothetical protein
MTIPDHLKLKLVGFSGYRVAYVLAVSSFFLIPLHFEVSCEVSGAIFGISLFVLFITLGLSFFIPRTTPHRSRPATLALFAALAHMFCTH